MLIALPQADKKDFPLYLRLINEIKSKIHSGKIAAGEKMPSLRKLAHDLEVSRTTAEAAYSQLVAEGYLIASPKRGYFAGSIVSRKPQKVLPPQKPSAAAIRYDFGNNYIDSSLFPASLWKRCLGLALEALPWPCPAKFGAARRLRQPAGRALPAQHACALQPRGAQRYLHAGTDSYWCRYAEPAANTN